LTIGLHAASKLSSIERFGDSVLKSGVLPSSAPPSIDFRQKARVSLMHEVIASLDECPFLRRVLAFDTQV
jgi:hypothetical protein